MAKRGKSTGEYSPLVLFTIAGIVVCIMLINHAPALTEKTDDLWVEVFGFFLDIALFGVILTVYDSWRNRRARIRGYHEQLADYCTWRGEEGLLRKVGIIKRLREMHAPLPKLSDVQLPNVDLAGISFDHAELTEWNLAKANLSKASLRRANLSNVVLSGSDLRGADLNQANLERADLSGAHLDGANLRGAKFSKAKVADAELNDAHLEGAHLLEALGLDARQLLHAHIDDKTRLPLGMKKAIEDEREKIRQEEFEAQSHYERMQPPDLL